MPGAAAQQHACSPPNEQSCVVPGTGMASAQVPAQVETQFPVDVGCQPPGMSTADIQDWTDCDCVDIQCCVTHTHMGIQDSGLAVSHHGNQKEPAHITHRLYLNASTEMCSDSAASDCGIEKSI